MRVARLLTAGILGSVAALSPTTGTWADSPATQPAPATQPSASATFDDLIKKCVDYDQTSSNWKWSTVYTGDFRPGQPATWQPDPYSTDVSGMANPSVVQFQLIPEEGHNDLLINGQACQFTFVDVGPKIRGEIAIEMLCKSIGPRLNDLSLVLGSFQTGPGFQFGSNDNTKALLWPGTGPNEPGSTAHSVVPPGSPQTITINRWYRIRMEVKDGQVRALVDGKEIGKVPLNPNYPLDAPHSAILYTYNSQMVIRELHVEAYARDPHGVDATAWSKVFGTEAPEAVQTQLDSLVRLLADRDAAIRDKTESTLTGMGILAIPALQRAQAGDVPELSLRAATILQTLNAMGRSSGHGQ